MLTTRAQSKHRKKIEKAPAAVFGSCFLTILDIKKPPGPNVLLIKCAGKKYAGKLLPMYSMNYIKIKPIFFVKCKRLAKRSPQATAFAAAS
ncbi:MAG TPA: hypothetical protein DF383_01465 [Deltaproteobacteria bacterium]|nr:hypothetical protein [Deltaproteobacteria bacterium]